MNQETHSTELSKFPRSSSFTRVPEAVSDLHTYTVDIGTKTMFFKGNACRRNYLLSIVGACGTPYLVPSKDGRTPIARPHGDRKLVMPIYLPLPPRIAGEVAKFMSEIQKANIGVTETVTSPRKRTGKHLADVSREHETNHINLINSIKELALTGTTVGEISNALDIEMMEVISISRTNGIYVHDGRRDRKWAATIVNLASKDLSLDQIFSETGIPRQTILSLSERIITGNGEGAFILKKLLTIPLDTNPSVQNNIANKEEIMIDISVTQESPVTHIGRKVRVLAEAGKSNSNLEVHQGKEAIIVSVLDHVVGLRFDHNVDVLLARLEEVRLLKGDSEWKMGEEVMFTHNGTLAEGTIVTILQNYQNTGVHYLVNMDGVQDIVAPSAFIQ